MVFDDPLYRRALEPFLERVFVRPAGALARLEVRRRRPRRGRGHPRTPRRVVFARFFEAGRLVAERDEPVATSVAFPCDVQEAVDRWTGRRLAALRLRFDEDDEHLERWSVCRFLAARDLAPYGRDLRHRLEVDDVVTVWVPAERAGRRLLQRLEGEGAAEARVLGTTRVEATRPPEPLPAPDDHPRPFPIAATEDLTGSPFAADHALVDLLDGVARPLLRADGEGCVDARGVPSYFSTARRALLPAIDPLPGAVVEEGGPAPVDPPVEVPRIVPSSELVAAYMTARAHTVKAGEALSRQARSFDARRSGPGYGPPGAWPGAPGHAPPWLHGPGPTPDVLLSSDELEEGPWTTP